METESHSSVWRRIPPAYVSLGVLALAALFLGFDIQSRPIVLWDESRVVSNALEMSKTGFSLITTYDFRPDMWNTKPPLAVWLVAASIRLFGASEWAVRLPSLLAAIATLAVTMKMTWWLTRNRALAYLSVAVLVLSSGFYGHHAAQSADYDTILGLFVTCYLFCFFYLVHHKHNKAAWVAAFGLFVVLACLTKGVAGLIPGVGIPVYLIAQKRWSRVLALRYFAVGAAAVLLVGAYYYFREQINPGYLAAVEQTELEGRFVKGASSHFWGPFYYFRILASLSIVGAIAPVLVLVAAFTKWPESRSRAFCLYGVIVVCLDLLILSSSKTKAFWYLVPIYPILSVTTTLLVGRIWERFRGRVQPYVSTPKLIALAAVALAGLLVFEISEKVGYLSALEYAPQGQYGRVFAQLYNQGISRVAILDSGEENADGLINYSPQLHFYSVLWSGRGLATQIFHAAQPAALASGRVVATCDPSFLGAVRTLGRSIAQVRDCAVVIDGPGKPGEMAQSRQQTRDGACPHGLCSPVDKRAGQKESE